MASLRLFYFIEKNVIKAKNNPMWKNYIRNNSQKIDRNPEIVEDLITLFRSTGEYKVRTIQKLLDLYNIGIYRDPKKHIKSIAEKAGLRI